MLSLSNRRIFIALKPVDMRRGIDTLAGMVTSELGQDPYAGDVFVFIGKDQRRLKVLTWDLSGFWLALKRLERGTFATPLSPAVDLVGKSTRQLSAAELQLVIEGVVVHHATFHPHYHRSSETVMNNSS